MSGKRIVVAVTVEVTGDVEGKVRQDSVLDLDNKDRGSLRERLGRALATEVRGVSAAIDQVWRSGSIRERPLVLRRTCGDRTCNVCSSRWHDVCVGGWRCDEWPGRPLQVLDGVSCTARLPECLDAEAMEERVHRQRSGR